jgi:uncharacterized phiE125 gp8 family phage protein
MSLLDLTVVKPHLRIDQTTDDAVLQAKLDAAEAFVSRAVSGPDGTLAATAVTEVDYWTDSIVLLRGPIVNVTSVTGFLYGNRMLGDLLIQPSGVIRSQPLALPLYADKYTVIYTAGYEAADDLSPELVEAVRLMTQHFYGTQRGTGRKGTGGDQGSPLDAFARAQQILDEFRVPGFA